MRLMTHCLRDLLMKQLMKKENEIGIRNDEFEFNQDNSIESMKNIKSVGI